MTTFTFTPTEDDVFTALRAFLQDILPRIDDDNGHEIIVGQENLVAEPVGPNYVVMTPLRMPRLATNFVSNDGPDQLRSTRQSTQVVVQLDIHGPEAFNNAGRISTLFRDAYATEFFETYPAIAPLFADDPRQAQFVDGEKQYEDRYIVEANMQVKFTAVATAQSARTLTVGIIDVETEPASSWPNSTVTVTG